MKKIFATIAAASLMLVCGTAFAQIGVGAGYVNSTIATNGNAKAFDGAYAGIQLSKNFGNTIGVLTGAEFSYLVNSSSSSISIASASEKTTEMYVDIPVNLSLGINFSRDLRWFIFGGPTASIGISSKSEGSASLFGLTAGTSGDNYESGNYSRFDVLLGGGIGIDFSAIRFTAGYQYGMLNRTPEATYPTHRSLIHVGLAFLF